MARRTDDVHMRCRLLIAASMVTCMFVAHAAHANDELCLDDAPVCIEAVQGDATTSFFASNKTHAPYSIRVAFEELENLEAVVPLPLRAVVPAGGRRLVGSLKTLDASTETRFRYRFRAALGSSQARPSSRHRYRMPFGGNSPRFLSQGVGGRHTHTGASKWAFDFAMLGGTPVLAARGGIVVEVVDGHVAGGAGARSYDKANRVTVLHPDGSLAMYAHLRRGAVVEVGNPVRTGDLVGLSGDTGRSTGPHLHFMVWKRQSDLSLASVPIRFHDGSAEGMIPTQGVAYAPGCSSSGAGCRPGEIPPRDAAVPAAQAPAAEPSARRPDGACACSNGAVIHVDLPCSLVCGR
jgi:murein DD-endopeptidase MepM/ murein hydrolase activator NlpD